MRKWLILWVLAVFACPGTVAALDIRWDLNGLTVGVFEQELLAKAQPDECFQEIGISPPLNSSCSGTPKTNEAYVWGSAQAGDKIWFGSAPNVHCLVIGGYLGMTAPFETESWACEFSESYYSTNFPYLPAEIGDWRPAGIYVYDLGSDTLTDVVAESGSQDLADALGWTLGIRSAGAHDGVAFLAGPNFRGGITLFAFNAETYEFLGSQPMTEYSNIRKWLVYNNELYTAVGLSGGSELAGNGGRILKWTGSLRDPFQFQEVGILDGSGAELAAYGDRIAVTTWPGPGEAGLFVSPPVPAGGLTQNVEWTKVWEAGDYEPDPVTAQTYGGGALAFFDGWMYWGTMNVPFLSTAIHFQVYGTPESELDALTAAQKTHRAIAIFRGRNLHDPLRREIQLLYGERQLPVYNPVSGTFVDTSTGMIPRFGASGFGNIFNNYTWTMAVSGNELLVGTMDWSYLFDSMAGSLLEGSGSPVLGVLDDLSGLFPRSMRGYGADLWRFSSSWRPAVAESTNGLGNYLNYGIRTLIVDQDDPYVNYPGTANPMNLEPDGGWELMRLEKPKPLWSNWFRW